MYYLCLGKIYIPKNYILSTDCTFLNTLCTSVHSLLVWISFYINYCIPALLHGGHQSVSVTVCRCNGSPDCFDSSLCIVESGVCHFPLDNSPHVLSFSHVCMAYWFSPRGLLKAQ